MSKKYCTKKTRNPRRIWLRTLWRKHTVGKVFYLITWINYYNIPEKRYPRFNRGYSLSSCKVGYFILKTYFFLEEKLHFENITLIIKKTLGMRVSDCFVSNADAGGVCQVLILQNLNDWELNEYEKLMRALAFVSPGNNTDFPWWTLTKKGSFMVKSWYKRLFLCEVSDDPFLYKQIWKVKVPTWISFFAWEAGRECILTIDKLRRTGLVLVNACNLSKQTEESCSPFLLQCPLVYLLQTMVYKSIEISWGDGRISQGRTMGLGIT